MREWQQEQKTVVKRGCQPQDSTVRFSEVLVHFVKDIAGPTVKPKTFNSHRWLIESHIGPHLGGIPPSGIELRDIQDLMTLKLEEGLSKRSGQHMHAIIRKTLNEALKAGLKYRNPAALVWAHRPEKKPLTTLPKGKASLFLESVKDHQWYQNYALAITTGMRQGEIRGFQWESIDYEKDMLSVRHTLRIFFYPHDTFGTKNRFISPDHFAIAICLGCLKEHQERK